MTKKFKSNLGIKFFAIKKILKSKKFVVMDFKKIDKENGYAEGYFSAGFTESQIKGLMTIGQEIHIDNMKIDNMESVVEEAKQLIKN